MTKHTITMLLSAFVLLLTSCQEKERFVDVSGGDAVQFIIGSKGSELSKAEYSGVEYTTGESKKVEKIYWKKGDMFRLYSEQALASYTDENKHHADYKSLNDTDAENDWAELIQADPTDMGLRFVSGEDKYTFYGMYPSPLVSGIGTDITKNTVTANLASEQGFVSATKDDNGDWTVTPDLKWMLMTAKKEIKTFLLTEKIVYPPIKKGDIVGCVRVCAENGVVRDFPLIADESVGLAEPLSKKEKFINRMKELFGRFKNG